MISPQITAMLLLLRIATDARSQCSSFRFKRKRNLNLPFFSPLRHVTPPCSRHCFPSTILSKKYTTHHIHAKLLTQKVVSSLRSGGDDGSVGDGDENEYDEPLSRFIESFESELAQIRMEAEMEAEKEMRKLRGLLDYGKDYKEETDEEDMQQLPNSEDEGSDNSQEEPVMVEMSEPGSIVAESRIFEEKSANDMDMEATEEGSSIHEVFSSHGDDVGTVTDLEGKSDDKYDSPGSTSVSLGGEECYNSLGEDRKIVGSYLEPDEGIDISPNITTSDSDAGIKQTSSVTVKDQLEIDFDKKIEVAKPIQTAKSKTHVGKRNKKYASKMSRKKPTSKSTKARIRQKEMKPVYHGDEVGQNVGTSCVSGDRYKEIVSPTHSVDSEVISLSTRIGMILRTDLARALTLFIATVILSLWMQRLQRRLEAEGL